MHGFFFDFVVLILIILGLVMLAQRLRVAYPILLVLGGLALSFAEPFSQIAISPELVFFIFLPPLLYESAWQVSWKELWKWRRVISSFAFPIVILTSTIVALVSTVLIPGFTLALGFLLGGIISPPDAISASTIMRQVKVRKSMLSIIEGESLLNDASSLIVFRFALAAVLTGQFHLGEAVGSFALVISMGILIGLAVGLLFYGIHRWLPTTPSIEIILTLVTPYCMYYVAESYHYSGVLAVVSGGLLLSGKRYSMLSYQSRIQGVNVWTNLTFVLNGIVFMLIGLQLPAITRHMDSVGVATAIGYGLAISALLIVTRLACTIGASYFTRFMSRFITVADTNPGLKGPLIMGWSGMRGVVSLAAALAIPLTMDDGQAFPQRNLILFITFVVILVTLVLQGLTLPWLIHKLNITPEAGALSEEEQVLILQKKLSQKTLHHLEESYAFVWPRNAYLKVLHDKLQLDKSLLSDAPVDVQAAGWADLRTYQSVYLDLLERQRTLLHTINHKAEFDEDLIREQITLIDLEELKIRERHIPEQRADASV